MKKFLSIVLVFILIFSLTACGNSPDKNNAKSECAIESPQSASEIDNRSMNFGMEMNDSVNETANEKLATDNRKIIKHNNLDLQTKDFDSALSQILETIENANGYVEFNETSGRNLYNQGKTERSATIRARIPVEKLEETTLKMGEICNIRSQNSSIEDITDSYFDTDARLKSMTAQETRLLELLQTAQSMEDIIQIEQKLSEIRFGIERLTASIKRMDNQIAYSYLNLNLQEVIEYDEIDETFGNRISASLNRSKRNIINWGEDIVFFTIESLPILLLNLLIIAIIIFILIKINKKYTHFKWNKNSEINSIQKDKNK